MRELEKAVVAQLAADFQAPAMVRAYVTEIRKLQEQMASPAEYE